MSWFENLNGACNAVGIEELNSNEIVVTSVILFSVVKAFVRVPICQFKCRKGWADFGGHLLFDDLGLGLYLWSGAIVLGLMWDGPSFLDVLKENILIESTLMQLFKIILYGVIIPWVIIGGRAPSNQITKFRIIFNSCWIVCLMTALYGFI